MLGGGVYRGLGAGRDGVMGPNTSSSAESSCPTTPRAQDRSSESNVFASGLPDGGTDEDDGSRGSGGIGRAGAREGAGGDHDGDEGGEGGSAFSASGRRRGSGGLAANGSGGSGVAHGSAMRQVFIIDSGEPVVGEDITRVSLDSDEVPSKSSGFFADRRMHSLVRSRRATSPLSGELMRQQSPVHEASREGHDELHESFDMVRGGSGGGVRGRGPGQAPWGPGAQPAGGAGMLGVEDWGDAVGRR